MTFEQQLIFDKGWTSLAYQLEAMTAKAPEHEDDFDNLTWLILGMIGDLEQEAENRFHDGYNEGHSTGYWDASFDYGEDYATGYDDGKRAGYEEGYSEGLEAG